MEQQSILVVIGIYKFFRFVRSERVCQQIEKK